MSVRSLADSLGVSSATVSRALNNDPRVATETRARVLELADELGYVPRVGQRMSRVIGLVYPDRSVMPEFGSFEANLLAGIRKGVIEHRCDLLLIEAAREKSPEETYAQYFRRKGVRGVIVRNHSESPSFADEIAAEGIPSILVADHSSSPNVSFIRSASLEDTERITRHLLDLGHRRIALLTHSVLDTDHRDRAEGFSAAHRSFGLDDDPSLVLTRFAGLGAGRDALGDLLAIREPPTAIVCTNPRSTAGVLYKCLELGIRVPEDFSVVGFDDGRTRFETFPEYTAVCQDAQAIGYEATSWLARKLDGLEEGPFRCHRPTEVDFRSSTGPVPENPPRVDRASVQTLESD